MRSGWNVEEARQHISECDRCRLTIDRVIHSYANTTYKGDTTDEVLENAKERRILYPRFNYWE